MKIRKLFVQFVLIFSLILPLNVFAQEASSSATLTITPSPSPTPALTVAIDQNSNLINDKSIQITTSGTATAEASISQNVNQNSVGRDLTFNIVNTVAPNNQPINLANVPPCQINQNSILAPSAVITASNSAQIVNNINVDVVASGSATAKADIATIANTNLAGNCGSFNIVNLFDKQQGDIILPNELNYISPTKPVPGVNNMFFSNTNNAAITNNVTSSARTENSGDANNLVNVISAVNTNIVGNNWLFLRVNNFGVWKGSLDKEFTLWWQGNGDNSPDQMVVDSNNSADIANNISLSATSNYGNASTIANISSLINTNIVGNNWLFALINNFSDFTGNVVFYRPDPPADNQTQTAQSPTNNVAPTPLSAPTPTATPTIVPNRPVLFAGYQNTNEKVLGTYIHKSNLPEQKKFIDYCENNSFACGSIGVGTLLAMLILLSGNVGYFKKNYEK